MSSRSSSQQQPLDASHSLNPKCKVFEFKLCWFRTDMLLAMQHSECLIRSLSVRSVELIQLRHIADCLINFVAERQPIVVFFLVKSKQP